MKIILLVILLLPIITFAQKVIYDKKDPFTNERNITAGNSVLSNIIQAAVSAKITDTNKIFYVSFLMPAIQGAIVETVDSAAKECKLKTSNGQIYTGRWFGATQMPIAGKFYHSGTYILSESDFRRLSESDITDIKTENGLFEIPMKNKPNLAKLCKTLLSRL